MRNVRALPGSLSTWMWPPLCLTMPYTVARPSPVPLPGSLVVKNGSKMRARVASSMPVPVSVTASIDVAARSARRACAESASSSSTFAVSIVSRRRSAWRRAR